MKFRAGRITASHLYQVTHSDPHKPSVSLIKAIYYPETVKFATKSTSYGCKHDKIATDKYKSVAMQTHKRLKVTSAGLILKNQKFCFRASPDSLL